MHLPSLIERR